MTTTRPAPVRGTGWTPTPALRRAALTGAALLGTGLVLGRPDLALLAAPLVVGTAISLRRSPSGVPTARAEAPRQAGQGRPLTVTTRVDLPDGATLATVLVPEGTRVPAGAAVTVAGSRVLLTTVRPGGWGRLRTARPDLAALAADGLLVWGPRAGAPVSTTVLPAVDVVPPATLAPRPAGLVGNHRSRRPGDGSDLLDVRPFLPGDRLRRIDWRVSARRGGAEGAALHVRRTTVDADADVVLCLDSRYDLGRDGAGWSAPAPLPGGAERDEATTLGIAVRTATALAAAHLRHGDRVALVDLARPREGLAAGSGRRHLLRLRHRLAAAQPTGGGTALVVRPGAVPTGALALVLSPFLDDAAADVAVAMHRRGARVVAVDVLPADVVPDAGRPWRAQAQRLVLAERHVRLARLAAAGVDVVPAHPAALHARLRRRDRAARR